MVTSRANFLSACACCAACAAGLSAARAEPKVRVIDINSTGVSALSPFADERSMAVVGTTGFFTANTAEHGTELWRTDGHVAGTALVKDIFEGPYSSSPSQLTPLGDVLLFTAYSPESGTELWRSDGTAAGTQLVRDLAPPLAWQGPTILGVINPPGGALAIFIADDGIGQALWATDGTDAGTMQLLALTGFAGYTPVSSWASVGATLFFVNSDAEHGAELWATDGTVSGTRLVRDIVPGPVGSDPNELATAAGRLYFSAATPETGFEPWLSDGTAGGTGMVGDLAPGDGPDAPSSKPAGFVGIGNRVYFSAYTDTLSRELWTIDDAVAGSPPHLVLDIAPGGLGGLAESAQAVAAQGRLFFTADDSVHGSELWVTDGTELGTRPVGDIAPGEIDSEPVHLMTHGGEVVFQAHATAGEFRLFRVDAATAGQPGVVPTVVCDLGVGVSGLSRAVMVVGGELLFPAYTNVTGLELFRADGSPTGATIVRDIQGGSMGSGPNGFSPLGGRAVFAAGADSGVEPYISDGTAEGTFRLADIAPGAAGSLPADFCGETSAIFTASVAGQPAWYRTDGTVAGTSALGVAAPKTGTQAVALLGQLCIFAGATPQTGAEPFVSDGTAAGVSVLLDIAPGHVGSAPFGFVACGSNVLFFTSGAPGRTDLWRTDGTSAGTQLVTSLQAPGSVRPVSTLVRPVPDTASGGYARVYFDATDDAGNELWVSDGTDEGTYRVMDIRPGASGSFPSGMCRLGSGILFSANDGASGEELWITDGVRDGVGTHRVRDILPGSFGSRPLSIINNNGRAYFAANDGVSGFELWSTDGTEAGTVRMTDVYTGMTDSVYRVLAAARGNVYFQVNDPETFGQRGRVWEGQGSPRAPILEPVTQTATAVTPPSSTLIVNNRVYYAGYAAGAGTGAELAVLDLCPADYNNSGDISVQDIFSFLEGFFRFSGQTGSGLGPDFDQNGTVELGDLFEFLRLYFTGC